MDNIKKREQILMDINEAKRKLTEVIYELEVSGYCSDADALLAILDKLELFQNS